MLVWNAMPSIVPMISPILAEDAWIASIVLITWPITSPPRSATSALWPATSAAVRVLSAEWRTVAEISSIDEAVSSRFAAACSVRPDRSSEAAAISLLALTIDSELPRTRETMLRSECCMSRSLSIRPAASSRPQGRGEVVRSPAVIASKCSCTSRRPPSVTRKNA